MHNTDIPIKLTFKSFKVPILQPVNGKWFVPCFQEITFKITLKVGCKEFQSFSADVRQEAGKKWVKLQNKFNKPA